MKFGDFISVCNSEFRLYVQRPTWRGTHDVSYGFVTDYLHRSGFSPRYEYGMQRKLDVLERLEVKEIGAGYIILNGATQPKINRYRSDY